MADGETFAWTGEYELNMNNRRTLSVALNVFEHFAPKLPEAYRDTPYVLLGQHRAVAAAQRAPAGAQTEVRRGRHDGPVDRHGARGPGRAAEGGRHAHSSTTARRGS